MAEPEVAPAEAPPVTEVASDVATQIVDLAIAQCSARYRRDIRETQRCSALLDALCRPYRGMVARIEPVASTRLLLPSGAIELTADGDAIIARIEEADGRDAAVRLTTDSPARLRADLLRVFLALETK